MSKINLGNLILGVIIGVLITLVATSPTKNKNDNANSANPSSSPKTQGSVNINDSPYIGNKNAKVGVVIFSDFECPYCQKFEQQTFDQINNDFIKNGKILFAFRMFPLPFHEPAADTDAEAALCVKNLKDNDAFFKMAKSIFEKTGLNGKGIPKDQLTQLATGLGVNEGDFKSCLDSNKYADQIKKDTEAGNAAGVTGTPSFVIGKLDDKGNVNGELAVGALTFENFKATIEKYQ